MNYVAIDPSLTCTAMVVNDKKFVYTTPTVAHTKKGELKRWFQECEDQGIHIRVFDEIEGDLTHSELELRKLGHFSRIVDTISEDIDVFCDSSKGIVVAIEGYSYSSSAGPLIDLVTFGTLLRRTIYNRFHRSDDVAGVQIPKLRIYQPTEVKQKAAALVYPAIQKGKKTEYRNPDGIAGGSFKKPEIYKALLHNTNLKGDKWVEFIREQSEEILDMKSIPKPIEDINDAKTLYEIIKAPQPLNK